VSGLAVLLCGGTGLDGGAVAGAGAAVEVIDDLCSRPDAAAATLRELGASRVVLGLCGGRPSNDLLGALRRAGAEPFGIVAVAVGGRERDEAARIVSAAAARLAALAPGESGRPFVATTGLSRRGLFSLPVAMPHTAVAVLDARACAGVGRCGLCLEACSANAIVTAGSLPAIDAAACTACGACVPHCPHGALRLAGAAGAQVAAQLEALVPGTDVVFACEKARAEAPPGWALVELPTLALVTPGWILQTRARGARVRLAPCNGACCAGADDVLALAERVIDGGAADAAAPITLDEPRATVDAVLRLAPTALLEHAASPLGLLACDQDRCTLCGACAAACPTSALRLAEDVDATVLNHDPAACVACARCVPACPERALAVARGIDAARLAVGSFELVRAGREACARCGADLPPRPMRRRLRELLPELAGAPLDLCAGCARKDGSAPLAYDAATRGERSST